jgi:hypothetical protein
MITSPLAVTACSNIPLNWPLVWSVSDFTVGANRGRSVLAAGAGPDEFRDRSFCWNGWIFAGLEGDMTGGEEKANTHSANEGAGYDLRFWIFD